MNKKLIIGLVFIVLIATGAFIIKPKSDNSSSQNQTEDIVGNIEKQLDQKAGSSAIVVPDNLQDCPSDWFQTKAGRAKIVCDESVKAPYCSYYTLEKDGVVKTKLLEFTSECAVCRNHKQKGEVFIDNPSSGKYTHLGYHQGACSQGMYKK